MTIYESLTNSITWVNAVQPGQTLVIEGPGHMAMGAILGARAKGVGTIIVTGLAQDRARLDLALRVGADHAIDIQNEDVVARVREITGGAMADAVLDAASGNPITIATGLDLLHMGGILIAAGIKDRPLDGLDVNQIPLRFLTILPGGGLDLPGACTMINEDKVPTADLAGAVFPLERFEEALAVADRRSDSDAVRVSLEVS
jgi:threonine dehydrogenase-like Zn-dependent dehydrogenase